MYYNVKGEKIYYAAPSAKNEGKPLHLIQLGETLPDASFKAFHRLEDNRDETPYTFEFVTAGKLIISQGEQKHIAEAGDVYILNRTASHYYYSTLNAPVGKYWFTCNGSYVDALMNAFHVEEHTVVRHQDFSKEFQELTRIAEETPDQLHYATAELILKILFALNPITNEESVDIQSPAYPRHRLIYNYIDAHIQEPLRLDQIAEHFSISRVTLHRIFKERYNTSPKQFILNAKITVAKHLLSTTNLTIKEITDYLSFGHQNNFTLAFTKVTGISPTQFRKQVSNSEALPDEISTPIA